MRRLLRALAPILLAGCGSIWGQAMVEHSLVSGHSATSGASASGIGGAMDKLGKMLDSTLKSADRPAAVTSDKPAAGKAGKAVRERAAAAPAIASAPLPPPPPPVHYEDAKLIENGMVYDDVVRRFGPGAMQVTTGLATKTLSYLSPSGPLQVLMTNGKVSAIERM